MIDVSPDGETEARNRDAKVTCEYEALSGDIGCRLTVYGTEELAPQPSVGRLATVLARELDTAVLVSWGTLPWIRQVVTSRGGVTFARVEYLEDEQQGYRVYATEAPVPEFPAARVEGFPEVVRDLPVATPVADGLFPGAGRHSPAGEVRMLLWGWEALVSRMAAGWPPSRWYGADMYREDLQNRDRLDSALQALAADDRERAAGALAELDARFRDLTVDDGGAGLAAALTADARGFSDPNWYWRRRPAAPPWMQEAST
ncbi:hypothetical protein [Streptomyces sp. NPDC090445]|uniref:hypothetical protein n=1 Tax=Streptomyces sp. NPDC090445 TaxID=3365963 RepID=UPI00380AA097